MNSTKHLSIQKKLTRIILITCGASVVAACTVFAGYDLHMVRRSRLQSLTTLAQVTGANSSAAIEFDDPKSASDILQSLHNDKQVLHAALYSAHGEVIAVYHRDGEYDAFTPPPPAPDEARISGDQVIAFQSIQFRGKRIGTIYLESDISAIRAREWGLAAMLGFALLAASLVALAVGPKLQKRITEPILELARTAFAVSVAKNYSIRAVTKSGSEIGYLFDQFNQMLEKIQQRDQQLEQVRADLEVRVAERTTFLSALIDSSPLAIVVSDQSGCVQTVNYAFTKVFGYSRDEAVGKRLDDLIASGEFSAEAHKLTQRRIEGELFRVETQRKRKDGTLVDVEIHGVPLTIQGKVAGGFALYQDITERHRSEAAVREANSMLSALFEASPLAIAVTSPDGTTRSINGAFTKIFGYAAEEAAGKNLDEMVASTELLEEARKITRDRVLGGIYQLETRRKRRDGSLVDVELHSVPLTVQGKSIGSYAMYEDISKRKQAEEGLRDANAKLNAVIQASPLGIVTTDRIGRIRYCNPAFMNLFQFTCEEATGKELNELIVPQELRAESEELTRRGQAGQVVHATTRRRRKDGELLDVELFGVSLIVGDELAGGLVLYQDISERRRAEEAVREANETFSAIFNASPVPIVGLDLNAQIVKWNPAAQTAFGWSASEVMGHRPPMVPASRQEMFDTIHREAIQGHGVTGLEVPVQKKDGVLMNVSLFRAPLRDASGAVRGTVDILMDITERKRAENALRESEERFRLIAETITEVFWISDPSISTIYYISPGYEHVWGRSLASLQENPRSFIEGIHPEDRERVISELVIQREGKPFDHEYRIMRPDGSMRWIWDRGFPVRDSTGEVTRYVGVAWDITDRKTAEESLRKLSQALEQSAESILITDENGTIEFVNPGFTELTGYTSDEVIGHTPRILKSGKHQLGFYQNFWATIIAGKVYRGVFINKKKTGELFHEEKTVAPVKDAQGAITNFVAVGRDITRRKQAEEELKTAKKAAEEANKAKSAFLANMSHEIRTPMNGIIGMTELALETELSTEQREYLEMVKTSADSLLRVINDILDFSKIEAGKLEFEFLPFALRESLGETMKALGHSAHSKKLELAWEVASDVPEWIVGDRGRLRQMVVNLAGNAIKFTERGEVVLKVNAEQKRPESVELHFQVRDTGIGIPADKQTKIFGAFTQADGSTTRKYGGTGLGLAIVQRLVAMQQGKLWLESEEGKGSIFHFTLNFGLPGKTFVPPKLPEPDELRGLPVLAVDDNQTNRRILTDLLKQWGMQPAEARSGKEALEILKRAEQEGCGFPLVVIDEQMPEMDGFTLAKRIKENARLASVSIIMLSSAARSGDAARSRNAGIAAYLIKPAQPSELLDSILDAMAKPQSIASQSFLRKARSPK